jgi:2-hydroxy-3-oxopropionate reductase
LDAPVSGGEQGAIDGTLSIMVGGTTEALERARPLLEVLGSKITHFGVDIGSGGYAKLANQIMVSIHLASVAEAFVFARKACLDLAQLVEALEAGWANSTVLQVKAPKILADDYSPVGTVTIQHKDLSYIMETAKDLGVDLPLSPVIKKMYERLIEAGEADRDQMALIRAVAGDV